jgi:hypothetical protein
VTKKINVALLVVFNLFATDMRRPGRFHPDCGSIGKWDSRRLNGQHFGARQRLHMFLNGLKQPARGCLPITIELKSATWTA